MNTTPLTPPPADSPAPAPQRARAGWITPVLVIVGSIALVVALASAVVAGIRMFTSGNTTSDTVSVQGISALDIDSSGAAFTLEYGNVAEARLDVQGATGWTLDRRDETLVVRAPIRWFGGWWLRNDQHVTLTLPASLQSQGLDADLELSSGRLTASGDFGELTLKVNAGRADVTGSASELDVTVNAGLADLGLSDVSDAEFQINAGRIEARLTGSTPDAVHIDVNAGELILTVPDDTYNVSSNVSAGSFDGNGLQTASASRHTIDVNVSAGSAVVRPGN